MQLNFFSGLRIHWHFCIIIKRLCKSYFYDRHSSLVTKQRLIFHFFFFFLWFLVIGGWHGVNFYFFFFRSRPFLFFSLSFIFCSQGTWTQDTSACWTCPLLTNSSKIPGFLFLSFKYSSILKKKKKGKEEKEIKKEKQTLTPLFFFFFCI